MYARVAAENAEDLLADATLLVEGGRWARASSVAILAIEEEAKALVCCILPLLPDSAVPYFAWPFAEINRGHGFKLQMAGVIGHIVEFFLGGADASTQYTSELAELDANARSDNVLKQRGLYVGIHDGSIEHPRQCSEDVARSQVLRARRLLPVVNQFIKTTSDLPSEILEHCEAVWAAMIDAYAESGLDGMADLSNAAFGGLSTQEMADMREMVIEITEYSGGHPTESPEG